jgi:hypothetical protein
MSLTDTLTKLDKKKKRQEARDAFYENANFIKGDPGQDGHTPTDAELLALITPLIPKVKDGEPGKDAHTPTAQELLVLIRPLIPKVRNGVDGKTPTKAELIALIKSVMPVPKDGSPDTPQEIKDKLIELPVKEQWFDFRHLKNVPQENGTKRRGIVKGGITPLLYTITSLDGATKSFTIPANNGIFLVIATAAPFFISPPNYSGAGTTTITFGAGIDAPTTLAAGQEVGILYIGG